jgi:hypothetical protein
VVLGGGRFLMSEVPLQPPHRASLHTRHPPLNGPIILGSFTVWRWCRARIHGQAAMSSGVGHSTPSATCVSPGGVKRGSQLEAWRGEIWHGSREGKLVRDPGHKWQFQTQCFVLKVFCGTCVFLPLSNGTNSQHLWRVPCSESTLLADGAVD